MFLDLLEDVILTQCCRLIVSLHNLLICPTRRLSENALFPKLCVMLKKLSSEYQPYACCNFFRKP